MAFIPGQAVPLKEPGAVGGYFELKAPLLRQTMQRSAKLNQSVLNDVAAGTTGKHIKRGQFIARQSDGTWKLVGTAGGTGFSAGSCQAMAGNLIEIAPSLSTTYDPDSWVSGCLAVLEASHYEAITDAVDTGYSAPAAGDYATVATSGLLASGSAGSSCVARVVKVDSFYDTSGNAKFKLTCRFKGTDYSFGE